MQLHVVRRLGAVGEPPAHRLVHSRLNGCLELAARRIARRADGRPRADGGVGCGLAGARAAVRARRVCHRCSPRSHDRRCRVQLPEPARCRHVRFRDAVVCSPGRCRLHPCPAPGDHRPVIRRTTAVVPAAEAPPTTSAAPGSVDGRAVTDRHGTGDALDASRSRVDPDQRTRDVPVRVDATGDVGGPAEREGLGVSDGRRRAARVVARCPFACRGRKPDCSRRPARCRRRSRSPTRAPRRRDSGARPAAVRRVVKCVPSVVR